MLDNVFAKENLPESKVQWILANDFGDLLMASFWDSKPYSCYKRLFPNQKWEGVSLVWTYSYMTMNLPVVSCETCYESPNPCFLINIEQKCWCWGTSDPYSLGSHAFQDSMFWREFFQIMPWDSYHTLLGSLPPLLSIPSFSYKQGVIKHFKQQEYVAVHRYAGGRNKLKNHWPIDR